MKVDFYEKFKDLKVFGSHSQFMEQWNKDRRRKKKRARLKISMPSKRKRRAYWKVVNPFNIHR